MRDYNYYLFDGDGTLFDTVDLICQCYQHVAKTFLGRRLDVDSIIAGIGAPLVTMLSKQLGSSVNINEALIEYQRFQDMVLADNVTLFPGVKETLLILKENNRKLAIVTSRRRPSLEIILDATGVNNLFEAIVTPEDTTAHKPDAAPVLRALSLLHASKEESLFVGDAYYDINSGIAAGIDTAFVTWSHTPVTSLPQPPTWTIYKMHELMRSLNTSPLN